MSTMTFAIIKSLVRDDLNESSTVKLTDTELGRIINDGYKEVSVKALGYEKKIVKTNISASERIISLVGENVIKVHYVEYDLGASGCIGMLHSLPNTVGYSSLNDATPQYWFQFGEYIIIEPVPDLATYDLNIYASCYPATELANAADLPSSVPAELHECIHVFSVVMACIKFARWGSMSMYYNLFQQEVFREYVEFMKKMIDKRKQREIPDAVVAQRQQ